jgi:glyoxylase-like metal-dependent hydrolase (beta-lactamase superfamily II)
MLILGLVLLAAGPSAATHERSVAQLADGVWLILATGDLVVHPVPYLGGGSEFPATLRALARIDASLLVPGHGEVLRDRTHLERVAAFQDEVVAAVTKFIRQTGKGKDLEAIQKAVEATVDVAGWRKTFAGDDKDGRELFDTFSYPGLLNAATAEVRAR